MILMAETAETPLIGEPAPEAPRWELAECTCPDWCERDHEQD